MKAHGRCARLVLESRRQKMLTGMLLHVVEAAGPVDVTSHSTILLELAIDDMGDRSILLVDDVSYRRFTERTGIEWLAARRRDRRPCDRAMTLHLSPVRSHVAHDGVELDEVRIGVIETIRRHGPPTDLVTPASLEAARAQHAAVAPPARRARRQRIVAAVRQAVIEAQRQAARDDLRLRHRDERRLNAKAPAFDAGLGRQPGRVLERLDELRPAIGIAGVVEGVDADEDIAGAQHLRPRQRQRQHHRIASRHIRRLE